MLGPRGRPPWLLLMLVIALVVAMALTLWAGAKGWLRTRHGGGGVPTKAEGGEGAPAHRPVSATEPEPRALFVSHRSSSRRSRREGRASERGLR